MLKKKFKVKIDEAILFYYDLCNRRKIEHFINHFDKFNTFEELKKFYLGGN
jgi:hypothetical protein